MKYLLKLGRVTDLCFYEVTQCFPDSSQLQLLDSGYVLGQAENLEEIVPILDQTAGVVKAFEILDSASTNDGFINKIVESLVAEHRSDFSIFFYPHRDPLTEMKEIKSQLKENGISGRYVSGQVGGLSASILRHKRVNEYGIVQIGGEFHLLKNIWTQNIDHWSIKDIDKPHRDPDRGMLPPKLARMMINFLSPEVKARASKRLYDPFCGTGTILMEGAELGWEVLGSDLAQSAINQSGENLHWFTKYKEIKPKYSLFTSDATQVMSSQLQGKVDAIVTEPFLGKQQPKPAQLQNIFKGLEKMYWGSLKRFTQILSEGGEIVLVTPLVDQGERPYSLAKLIDKSQELGYSIISGPLVYSREHTIVQRSIYHLKYK